MTTFNQRQDAFEKRFAVDEELRFKASARRNRLLGAWVAEKLGKTGEEAAAYAKSLILADLAEAGDDDVFRKVRADLDAAGAAAIDEEVRMKMSELLAEAVRQIEAAG